MSNFQRCIILVLGLILLPLSVLAAPDSPETNVTAVAPAHCDGSKFIAETLSLGNLRSDFQGLAGMWFTVGPEPLKVTCLGRMFSPGNSGRHTVKLVQALDGTDVPGGSVSVNMAGGLVNQFVYAALPAPLTLRANTGYYLVSEEFAGGDAFHDYRMTILKTSGVGVCNDAVYKLPWTGWGHTANSNRCYGPVDFLVEGNVAPNPPGPVAVTSIPSPPAGGTATADATYPAGSSVTMTAAENPGFVFVNWTEHGVEVSRSRSFTFTAVTNRDFVAHFSSTNTTDCSSQEFVTDIYSLGVLRSDFTGLVGMWLRVGPSPLHVTCLARMFSEGNNGTHTVKLVKAADFTDVTGGTINISMAGGTINSFVYRSLPAPVTLEANTDYFLVSDEVLGADRWRDYRATTVVRSSDATCVGAVYKNQYGWKSFVSPNHPYVPVNFRYQTNPVVPIVINDPKPVDPPAAAFTITAAELPVGSGSIDGAGTFALSPPVTLTATPQPGFRFVNWTENGVEASASATYSFAASTNRHLVANFQPSSSAECSSTTFVQGVTELGALRADFSGRVGMWITVGPQPLYVSCLGRQFSLGNSRTHTVKVVRASNRTDVPGAAVDIDMRGGVLNEFVYRPLTTPIVLEANTDYYIVTQEESGGDKWRDYLRTSITTAVGATCRGAVYMNAYLPWTQVASPNRSFALVDFRFQLNPPGTTPGPTLTNFHITTIANPVGGGSISGSGDYSSGTAVTVSALSNPGFQFVNWSEGGVAVSQSENFTFTADTNRLLVANFVATALPSCDGTKFVTGTPSLGALRRDFTGWVGMWLTTGPDPIQVTCLGRQFAAGNTRTHRVKFVRATDHADVPGGATDIPMIGGTLNDFIYRPLPTTITLAANTDYYLVTEETVGSDDWRDYTATFLIKRPEARCNGAVYASAFLPWTRIPAPDRVYGVVDFKFTPRGSGGGVRGLDSGDGLVKLDVLVQGGSVTLFAQGPSGKSYTIETSNNLLDWSPLGPITLNNGVAELKNAGTFGGPQFYRAVGY